MADNLLANLMTEFRRWSNEVIRLSEKVVLVLLTDSTDRINGYTFEDLKAIIQGEVDIHSNNFNNPHNLTLAQINGLSEQDIDALFRARVPKLHFPLSEIGIPFSTAPGTKNPDGSFQVFVWPVVWRGYFETVQDIRLEVDTNIPVQYIKASWEVIDMGNYKRVAWTLSNALGNSATNEYETIVGRFVLKGDGDYDAIIDRFVSFDGYRVSPVPAGRTIPASTGDTSGTGAIANSWF